MLLSIEAVDQWLTALNYREDIVDFGALEDGLSIIPSEGKAPPEFYLHLDGWSHHLPLTKIAAAKFGTISGVKPSIYKEFAKNQTLTGQMIHHSMNKPDRGGKVWVAYTDGMILGFYPAEKPHIGLMDSWYLIRSVGGAEHATAYFTQKGTFEIAVVMNDPTESVRPGIMLCHDGRPKIALYTTLHDHSAVLGKFKASKNRKTRESCDRALEELAVNRANEAVGEAQFIYNLAGTSVRDPARFISRLALMDKVSAEASNKIVSGVTDQMQIDTSLYDLTRYVAGFATREDSNLIERRYQEFAHFVAFRGASICETCALPN